MKEEKVASSASDTNSNDSTSNDSTDTKKIDLSNAKDSQKSSDTSDSSNTSDTNELSESDERKLEREKEQEEKTKKREEASQARHAETEAKKQERAAEKAKRDEAREKRKEERKEVEEAVFSEVSDIAQDEYKTFRSLPGYKKLQTVLGSLGVVAGLILFILSFILLTFTWQRGLVGLLFAAVFFFGGAMTAVRGLNPRDFYKGNTQRSK